MSYILGISAFYHDSAASLIKDGNIISAAQEERFTRIKHDSSYPYNAVKFVLNNSKLDISDVDHIVFYEKPFLKFERLLETYVAFAPKGFKSFSKAMPIWLRDKLFQKKMIMDCLKRHNSNFKNENKILFSEHHLSHAASAFYPSPFDEAVVLTADGVGEWATTTVAVGKGSNLEIKKEIHFPHSLGLLYSAFTYYTGFKVNSGEYKVMGLAPYGKPKYTKLIKEKLITIASDGSFKMDMSYFNFATGLTMTNNKFNKLFGGPPRLPETKLTQRDMDIAASIQKVTEDIILKIAKNIAQETGERNLCLAGGVALNCVANGILLREKIFENIWIQPAAGDAGGALGAALTVWHMNQNGERNLKKNPDSMKGSYLGPEFSDSEIKNQLKSCGAVFKKFKKDDLIDRVVSALVKKKAIGWMQGRMEFGPRALGARSIIADPRHSEMQRQLNLKVKYRESFRPFAPSVLSEHVSEWFELDENSPYMLIVAGVKKQKLRKMTTREENLFGIEKLNIKRSSIPAITHVDYSARIQTVHKNLNPFFHALISGFKEKTGCPLIINTSFNIRGEPIVCSPEDAFKCFMGTNLDLLAIGTYLLFKEDQHEYLKENYRDKYILD